MLSRDSGVQQLDSVVRINPKSIRSINIEYVSRSMLLMDGYIFTPQAQQSYARIASQLEPGSTNRSWTLTGPYGSGKSYFSLFMSNLLSKDSPAYSYATQQLEVANPSLLEKTMAGARLRRTRGLLPIPIVAYRGPVQNIFKNGFIRALEPYADEADIQSLIRELDSWSVETDSRAIVSWTERLLYTLDRLNYSGMLVLLDEMGKALEFAAQNPDVSDLYLLQEFAELANHSNESVFLFVGILHQSFAGYASHMDGTMQREWTKIQGRFEDISFQEPIRQQMWLLAHAIEKSNGKLSDDLVASISQTSDTCAEQDWLPSMMSSKDFTELSVQAYPLHPTTLVALPYVFRRLAQNERSMFAYLASQEPFGFQEVLHQKRLEEYVRLPDIFDYVVTNFQPQLYAASRARPITEAIERLSTASGLDPLSVQAIKVISILNWLGQVSELTATEENVVLALASARWSASDIQKALELLRQRSFIVFRRYNRAFAVWQGSDVDVEERLHEARSRLAGNFSTSEAIATHMPPQPVIARRHSYQKGTTRSYEVRYVDAFNRDQTDLNVARYHSGLVLLGLSQSAIEAEQFAEWARRDQLCERADIIVGVLSQTRRLHELLTELRSMRWVQENTPELRDDPVARRELRIRTGELETLIAGELERTLSLNRIRNQRSRWFHQGQEIAGHSEQSLAHLLSHVSDELYDKCPVVKNEIINQRVLSSQGSAARRNLIEAILEHNEEERLAIEGYPPERSIYESLIRAAELHVQSQDGTWCFRDISDKDPLGLKPVWSAIYSYIFTPPFEPRPIDRLYSDLESPPYGLTPGVIPVYLAVFMQLYRNEATLYREGSLIPEPGVVDWELLLRRPELYAVAGARVTGPRRAVADRLARGLRTEKSPLPIVRELIRQLKRLPDYAWRTRKLDACTVAVRQAIERAQSPEKLLFEQLPAALGLPRIGEEQELAADSIELFFERLNEALQELMTATPRLLNRSRDALLEAFGFSSGEKGWDSYIRSARDLAPKVTNPQLMPLLVRTSEDTNPNAVLESVLAYIADRPPRKWSDRDEEKFLKNLASLAGSFKIERAVHHPNAGLDGQQRQRSRQLVEQMERKLADSDDDPKVVQAALRMLLKRYETDLTQEGRS